MSGPTRHSPSHHRPAGTSRRSELRESVKDNRRRSKGPNHPRGYKRKASNRCRPSQHNAFPRKTLRSKQLKIRPDLIQPIHTEWNRLYEEGGEAPPYEVAAPEQFYSNGKKGWRCTFGQCDAKGENSTAGVRHAQTHYSLGFPCPNPSCGDLLSRRDALQRHYNLSAQSCRQLSAGATIGRDMGFRVSVDSVGAQVVRIKWV